MCARECVHMCVHGYTCTLVYMCARVCVFMCGHVCVSGVCESV